MYGRLRINLEFWLRHQVILVRLAADFRLQKAQVLCERRASLTSTILMKHAFANMVDGITWGAYFKTVLLCTPQLKVVLETLLYRLETTNRISREL